MVFTILACGIGSFGGAVWAGEVRTEPETVAPVEFGAAKSANPLDSLAVVAPGSLAVVVPNSTKGVSPNSLAFLAPSKSELVGAVGFNLNNVARDVALEQIKAGALTPEAAWQSGALTFDNIADLLEKEPDVYVIHFQGEDRNLHYQLIELLLQHESARFDSPAKVPQRVRLWLADYYQSQGNEKAIEVAESIVAEYQQPAKGAQDIVFQALEREAWFYQGQRKYELAAQAWNRVPFYVTNTDWMTPDAIIEEARCYRADGQTAKAKKIYDTVPVFGVPWQTTLALWDQCSVLFGQGHYKEAQLLVDQYKSDTRFNLPAYVSSLIEGKIAMKQEEWSHAHNLYIQAMKEYSELPRQSHHVEDHMLRLCIEQGLEWSQNWTKQRFFCDLRDMTAAVERDTDGVAGASWMMHIYSAVPISFKVECANPKVKIKINEQTDISYGYETTVSVDVDLPVPNDHVQEELRVFSLDHPNQVEKLPLFVEVK